MGNVTTRQKQYLRRLGHKEVANLTKEKASELIEQLLEKERQSGKQFACPYCKGKFGPRPKRRTKKCPHCGETIYHIVGKLYTKDGAEALNQAEWFKEQRSLVRETIREDWKEENAFRREFNDQEHVGYFVTAGCNCPHAKKVEGLLILLEDAKKHPDMLPPYDECRYNSCECDYDSVGAHEVPKETRVAQLASDPETGGRAQKTGGNGCASVILIACLFLVLAAILT